MRYVPWTSCLVVPLATKVIFLICQWGLIQYVKKSGLNYTSQYRATSIPGGHPWANLPILTVLEGSWAPQFILHLRNLLLSQVCIPHLAVVLAHLHALTPRSWSKYFLWVTPLLFIQRGSLMCSRASTNLLCGFFGATHGTPEVTVSTFQLSFVLCFPSRF